MKQGRNLRKKIDCDKYKSDIGVPYMPPDYGVFPGTIPVLEFIWDLPLCDMVLAYVRGLNPTAIRITDKPAKDEFKLHRVTIYADKYDNIKLIEQEVLLDYYPQDTLDKHRKKIEDEYNA